MPAAVTAVATRTDLRTGLFAEEVRSLGSAVDSRRREFETGRACARSALARLGLSAVALPSAIGIDVDIDASLTGRALRFEDADVRFDVDRLRLDADDGSFGARLLGDGPPRELQGRWVVADGIVATAVVVPR